MKYLPVKRKYCGNEMTFRFLNPPSKNEYLVLTIPGGPNLSGTYLDPFLVRLAERTNINVGILDLPNHGESKGLGKERKFSYEDCCELLRRAICELTEDCTNLILFGQSFGARLAFDLLARLEIKISGLFLTGFPHKFEHSTDFENKFNELEINPNDGPRINLKKKFSVYTVVPFPDELLFAINSELRKEENSAMLEETPSITDSAEFIVRNKKNTPITILEGDSDLIIPDNNLLELKRIIPQASCITIKKTGHYLLWLKGQKKLVDIFSSFLSSITLQ